jgi:hypothetical protein
MHHFEYSSLFSDAQVEKVGNPKKKVKTEWFETQNKWIFRYFGGWVPFSGAPPFQDFWIRHWEKYGVAKSVKSELQRRRSDSFTVFIRNFFLFKDART